MKATNMEKELLKEILAEKKEEEETRKFEVALYVINEATGEHYEPYRKMVDALKSEFSIPTEKLVKLIAHSEKPVIDKDNLEKEVINFLETTAKVAATPKEFSNLVVTYEKVFDLKDEVVSEIVFKENMKMMNKLFH